MKATENQEIHGKNTPDEFLTDQRFWDCECDEFYIHVKLGPSVCGNCGASGPDQPDSRANEIATGEHWATNLAWEFASMTVEYSGVPYFPQL